jgi:hypothetical protein
MYAEQDELSENQEMNCSGFWGSGQSFIFAKPLI